jgi:hypothetical protein
MRYASNLKYCANHASVWLWSAFALFAANSSIAQHLPLSNADFEQSSVSLGQVSATESVSGWITLRAAGSNRVTGVYWPSGSTYPNTNAQPVSRAAFIWSPKTGDGFAHELPSLAAGRYRITVALGLRDDPSRNLFSGAQIRLTTAAGVAIASRQIAKLTGAAGFTDVNLDASIAACAGCKVVITSLGTGNYLDLDDLRVEALSIPTSLNAVEQWGYPLEIINSDFENSSLAAGQTVISDSIPNWNRVRRINGGGVAGLWWPTAAAYPYRVDWPYGSNTAAPIGARGPVLAFVYGATLGEGWSHDVPPLTKGNFYRVNVSLGKRKTTELFGGATIAVKNANGLVLGSRTVNQLGDAAGFYDVGMDFPADSDCTTCRVEITCNGLGGSSGYLDLDNLRVEALQGLGSADGNSVTLDMPLKNQIFQRQKIESGNRYSVAIKVSGRRWAQPYAQQGVSVTATLLELSGQPVIGVEQNQVLAFDPSTGAFGGEVYGSFAKGGNFRLALDVRSANGIVARRIVDSVGVGDVFLIAGQSNSARFGVRNTPYTVTNPGRIADIANGKWELMFTDELPSISESFAWNAPQKSNSAWPQFADLLSQRLGVPVGVLAIGYGGSGSEHWVPGQYFMERYFARAIRFLDASGYKAVMWHQGEAETERYASPARFPSYRPEQTLRNYVAMISGMRRKAGSDVPWHVAEASYQATAYNQHGAATVGSQIRLLAALPNVRPGSNTDLFGVRSWTWDGIHFSDLGLQTHAQQWVDTFSSGASTSEAVINSGFSEAALNVGEVLVIGPNTEMRSRQSLVGWPAFNAAMDGAADGLQGVFSLAANAATYTTVGVDGKGRPKALGAKDGAYGFIYGASAGSMLRQTTGVRVEPKKAYRLNVNLGRRHGAEVFAGVRISLMLGEMEVATRSVTQADLPIGAFAEVAVNWTSGASVPIDTRIAIKLSTLVGGTNSYIDIDDVQLTAQP